MITAVDSSVLLDVFRGDPRFGAGARRALRTAYDRGALVACELVWAEVSAHFADEKAFGGAMSLLGVRFEAMSAEAAAAGGRLWRREQRRAGTSVRDRVVADFLIGAHAQARADALLTRDHAFYRRHFAGLKLIDPTHEPK